MNSKYMSFIKKITAPLQKTSGTSERGAQMILSIIIILLLNAAVSTCNMRCDLTRGSSFSLSKKSREVVRSLRENMKVKVLFSENLPAQHRAVFRYLNDILEEYNYYGSRYFSYEIISEKDLEKEAASYGISPIQSQEFSDDQATLRRTYMGLVIQHADLVEKINAITNTAGLEYEITSRMEKMTLKVNALIKLENPITVRLYYNSRLKSMPINGIDKLEQAVSEAVQSSAVVNYNKLVFESVDTALDTDIKKTAAAYGLNILQWKAMPGDFIFPSVVMINGGRFKVINLGLTPMLFGGYAVTGLDTLKDSIDNSIPAVLGSNAKVGYLSAHNTVDIDDNRGGDGGAVMRELLSDNYELVPVVLTQDIPDDITSLIIAGPKGEFTAEELYRLDQFLMAGNAALVFIDSFEEIAIQQSQPFTIPVESGLDEILKFYGAGAGKSIVLDPSCAQINLGQMIKDYTLLPVILKDGLNQKNPVTKYLTSAAFLKVSPVEYDGEKLKERGITAETLVSSSKGSWLMTDRVDFNPYTLDASKKDEFKSYPLSVSLAGKFKSFFKDKTSPLKEKEGQLKSLRKLDETIDSTTTRLIVTGTSQITRSGFLIDAKKVLSGGGEGEAFSNEVLLHAMVDHVSGNDYVPEMKSKSIAYNPIEKIGDGTRLFLKTVNIAGAPIFVIIAGLMAWRQRIRRKNMIRKKFGEE
ncbi:MAG: Gldg family protein [Leptospirales bacterium]|nr:Gldg family protein [Leptospirales bacterium]